MNAKSGFQPHNRKLLLHIPSKQETEEKRKFSVSDAKLSSASEDTNCSA